MFVIYFCVHVACRRRTTTPNDRAGTTHSHRDGVLDPHGQLPPQFKRKVAATKGTIERFGRAVINTGRSRVSAPSHTASSNGLPLNRRLLMKLTITPPLSTATPT